MSCERNSKERNDQRRGVQRRRKTLRRCDALNALGALRLHWPEYLMEAGDLGLYMFFACAFATLLQHPASPVRHFISSSLARRTLYGAIVVAAQNGGSGAADRRSRRWGALR